MGQTGTQRKTICEENKAQEEIKDKDERGKRDALVWKARGGLSPAPYLYLLPCKEHLLLFLQQLHRHTAPIFLSVNSI